MRDYIQGRGVIIDDNATHTGKFNYIVAITDCVVSAMTCALTGTFSGKTIPAGLHLRVDATSITLTSGQMVAYAE
jgi:hypothetical protein